jgi:hypothetical protein
MTIDIKHKHASHVIIIEGKAFKANDSGMWDLTDIWKALKLPKTKGPGKWAEPEKSNSPTVMEPSRPSRRPSDTPHGSLLSSRMWSMTPSRRSLRCLR